ncbi:hypothetical protein DSO57_1022027 [Entomophthora muscae]|uniref:Uncharacterized protein n=1 Tax=Entomophthora muscae TaxID=34485 RepID=A0ACC2UDD4_9FUNG|nr:hypothetical protein DSO57_1022027 [Entomophthora muscae]
MKGKPASSKSSLISDQTQEQHTCCLNHEAYINNKHNLWETMETVRALTNQLNQDLQDNCAQVAALKHKLDAYSKHLDLLASTTLLMEGNHISLLEQVQSNNTVRKDFEANISAQLRRLKHAMLSDNSLSVEDKQSPVPNSSPEELKALSPELFDFTSKHGTDNSRGTRHVPVGVTVLSPLTPLTGLCTSNQ